jgi:hypothetical protein
MNESLMMMLFVTNGKVKLKWSIMKKYVMDRFGFAIFRERKFREGELATVYFGEER